MLLIQSALESPLPWTKTMGGGPSAACAGRRGGCWASASDGHSAAVPPSRARREILTLSPPDIASACWQKPRADATLGLMSICYVMSPVGRLAVEGDHDAVTRVRWASPGETSRDKSSSSGLMGPVLTEAAHQLDLYF